MCPKGQSVTKQAAIHSMALAVCVDDINQIITLKIKCSRGQDGPGFILAIPLAIGRTRVSFTRKHDSSSSLSNGRQISLSRVWFLFFFFFEKVLEVSG
ncbi:hypothetical protein AAMO2058_001681000 [Amorphochlora amoebiformis]